MNRRALICGAMGVGLSLGLSTAARAAEKPVKPKVLPKPMPKPLSVPDLRKKYGLPAMVFAQQDRGSFGQQNMSMKMDGVRRMGQAEPVQAGDAWHIGSITKSMTALLAARLVEAGKIGWDDKIVDRIIGSAQDVIDIGYMDVKLHQILMHRGGFPANLPLADFARYRLNDDALTEQRARFANQALALTPSGPAGTAFLYSNIGYVIAAAMMEGATGESWENLIHKYVFDPLGINPGFGAPAAIWGHRRSAQGDKPIAVAPSIFSDNPMVMAPAGGVHITPADMMAYLRVHADRTSLLSADSWDRLHTPYPGGHYAMGWMVWPNGRRTHNGSNTYWYAECGFDPATGKAAFIATNDGYLLASQAAASHALAQI